MPKRERTIALVASLALALFLLAGFFSYQRQAKLTEAMGEMVTVWQASRPIAAYAPITQDMVQPVAMPRRYLQPGLITTDTDVTKLVSMADVSPNTILTMTHMVQPDSVAAELVKVTLSKGVQAEKGLVPGDLVMVVASYREGDSDVSKIFLPEARVVAIDTQGREPSVSLLVPVSRLEELIRIHDYGKAIHLTRQPLRGAGDGNGR